MAELSNESLAAAGLGETSSRTLWLPAAAAIGAASVVLALGLLADPQMRAWGGAASGHKAPADPVFLTIFAILICGALMSALLARSSLYTLLFFNAATALIAGLVLATVWAVFARPEFSNATAIGLAIEVPLVAGIWGIPFAVMQGGGSLAGYALRRIVRRR